MTRAATLKSLDCPNCGTGLPFHGGGRVMAMVCPSCGSTLSAEENFAAVSRFLDAPRPETPFELGMTGTIDGVEFTLIGILGLVEKEDGEEWRWVDHQLYSPTHGYAWLTLESGGLSFTRRLRLGFRPQWWDIDRAEALEDKAKAWLGGRSCLFDEAGAPEIDYAAGEFSWVPKRGDKRRVARFDGDDFVLTYGEAANGEREVELTTDLDRAATLEAFGLKGDALGAGAGPRVGRSRGVLPFLRNTAAATALITMISAFVASGMEPLAANIPAQKPPLSFEFPVATKDELHRVKLETNVSNSWAEMTVEVVDPKGETSFEAVRGAEYYYGRDSEGSWTEGSKSASILFRPTQTGTYKVKIEDFSTATWGRGRPATTVSAQVFSGAMATGWFWGAFGLSLVIALVAQATCFQGA